MKYKIEYVADYLSKLMDEVIYDVSINITQPSEMDRDCDYIHGNIWINLEFYASNPKYNLFYLKDSFGSIKLTGLTRDINGTKISATCLQGKETTELLSHILGK